MANYSIVPSWEITLHNQDGKPVAFFDNMERFVISKRLNDVGTFSISFVDDGDDRLSGEDYWQIDGVCRFTRDMPYFVGDIGEEYTKTEELQGLIRKKTNVISSDGEKTVSFEGVSPEHLLARRVIAANEGTTRADKNACADLAMREYVIENCGEEATPESGRYFYADYGDSTTRIDAYGVMPRFSIPIYGTGKAETWAGTKSMENLLDALRDIGESKKVDFYVNYIAESETFLFNVSPTVGDDPGIGDNRSFTDVDPSTGLNKYGNKPIVFSVEDNNVEKATLVYDRMNEATFVFVLGQGEMSTRSVYPAENKIDSHISPWNQIEIAKSASDNEYVYQLKDTANAALTESAYTEKIEFSPLQTPTCFYGFHYFLGDIVSVQFEWPIAAEYRIVGVTIEYDEDGEKISLEMESPTRPIYGTTPDWE